MNNFPDKVVNNSSEQNTGYFFIVEYCHNSNKNIKMSSFKSSETFKRKRVGQTDQFRIINPLFESVELKMCSAVVHEYR